MDVQICRNKQGAYYHMSMSRVLALLCVIFIATSLPMLYVSFKYDEYRKSAPVNGNNNKKAGEDDYTVEILPNDQNTTFLLLLTYLRSGSSFTADIIQQSREVFYIYEPLYPLLRRAYFTQTGSCSIYGGCRNQTMMPHYPEDLVDYLRDMFMCKFHKVPGQNRIAGLDSTASQDGVFYQKCMKTRNLSKQACVELLSNRCLQSSVRSIKFIRLSFEFSELLTKSLRNLKIIHLLRDPRGVITSRLLNGYLHRGKSYLIPKYLKGKPRSYIIANHAKQLCKQMENDLMINNALQRTHPGLIKTLLYEDLADAPLEKSKQMYDFLELTLDASISKYIYKITMSGAVNHKNYNTIRANSSKSAYSWRRKMSFSDVQIIDQYCGNVYERLGFIRIKSAQMLTNYNIKTRKVGTFFVNSTANKDL